MSQAAVEELQACLLGLLQFVVGRQLIEELVVHLHERFEHVVDERQNRLVPVLLRHPV